MNALFLKNLAAKTKRGQRGRIEAGRSAGGNGYGYAVVRELIRHLTRSLAQVNLHRSVSARVRGASTRMRKPPLLSDRGLGKD